MGDERAGYGLFMQSRPLECVNVDSIQLPAFGCADVVGAINQDGRTILQVKSPQEFGWRPCSVILGAVAVDPGRSGTCTDWKWSRALYDVQDGPPKSGEVWGPVKNANCKMRKYVPGGRILRDQTANDGPGVDTPKDTIVIQRYEPKHISCQAKFGISSGAIDADVNLVRWNKNYSSGDITNPSKFVNVPNVDFKVTEGMGTLSQSIPFHAYLYVSWDEQAQRYMIDGWSC
jgi:hypothetical protein